MHGAPGVSLPYLLLLACHDGGSADLESGADVTYVTDSAALNPPDTPSADLMFDADHELLVAALPVFVSVQDDGDVAWSASTADFVADTRCDDGRCRVEGVTPDGDGLLVNWALQNGVQSEGGVVRMDLADGILAPTWEMTGWGYPHEALRDPTGPYFVIADATLDAIHWVSDDGTGNPDAPVASIDDTTPGVGSAHTPNGLWIYRDGAEVFLLVSYRGNDAGAPGSEVGRLLCFDVTDRGAPSLLWAFPEEGNLRAPHNPSFHWRDDRWILLFAHSHGVRSESGSIGVAQTVDLRQVPTYIADLVPTNGAWGYPRGAELTGDDTLIITDTGTGGVFGAVYVAAFPTELLPEGGSGAYTNDGAEQRWVTVDDTMLVGGLNEAYRSILWAPTY